ncbi:MAG: putative structural protein [Prokaryotic dsDNA virus sp.]|nr:MAG: putative structural protein [Prokaryotic dsDNA virus sp.]|tara:strand:- start:854 stop:1822 length:969 start_codon:yes stop_codon:yes gene_type:complete
MTSLINTVRATVLSIANKNNFGYITPNDFNLYAKQAQLDIFEDYFYQYNSQLVKQNVRQSGSGYADIVKGIEEVVDSFSRTKVLANTGVSNYDLPEDYYLINKINYYNTLLAQGQATSIANNRLIDSNATFTSTVQVGSLVSNIVSGDTAFVVEIISNTELRLTQDLFGATDLFAEYAIVSTAYNTIKEVERVSQNKIFYLNSSPLTSPSTTYPAYVLGGANDTTYGNTITIYPISLTQPGSIVSQYIRYPKDPNWTYVQLPPGGEPAFNESALDYQDFELPISDEPNLVNKILQYAGVSIRDKEVAAFGKLEENEATKQEG